MTYLSNLVLKILIINLLILAGLSGRVQAQTGKSPDKGTPIELLQAGVLSGERINNEEVRVVRKDSLGQVLFRQEGAMMYCDSALQYVKSNRIEAFGHIQLTDPDGTVLTGDSLFYDGNTRIAKLRGQVIMRDTEKTVTTQFLDYNMNTKVASYFNGGTVQDANSTLTSERGYYNTVTKVVNFRKNVRYKSPDTELSSDTLTYNARNKTVYFLARTSIKTRDGQVITSGGNYNTVTGKSLFKGRARIETSEYIISGDFLDFNKKTEKGIAKKNVEFYGKKDNITILGDDGKYDGLTKRADIYGNAVLIKPDDDPGGDTLFLSADTLISINDTVAVKKRLLAFPGVKIYRPDFQGKCDSLSYHFDDSTFFFYRDPVLWTEDTQLIADSVNMEVRGNEIKKMNLTSKAFIISRDSLINNNQIKGRKIVANFNRNRISKVKVLGNGESIYYALEGDTTVMGLNYIRCADMLMSFGDSNKLKDIMFYQQPEGKFIPPHLVVEKDKYLENFIWRGDEKPAKGEVLGIHNKNRFRSGELASARMIIDDEFKVFLRDRELIFYRSDAGLKHILPGFFLHIVPVSKNDLPIEMRKAGFLDMSFTFPRENWSEKTRIASYPLALPDFKIAKIIVGQQIPGKGRLWQKTYIFKK